MADENPDRPMALLDLLPLSFHAPDNFLGLFRREIDVPISKRTTCQLHVLDMDGASLQLSELYETLINATLRYVLSRQNANAAVADPERIAGPLGQARARIKEPDPQSGEGGEMLLYAFLESHLRAPKILTKMELKTSGNDYVKGADGLHILERPDRYELIFGESKMYGDASGGVGNGMSAGIRAAFASMAKVATSGFAFERWLLNSEIMKETATPEALKMLRSVILPGPASPVVNGFGVLLGHEIDITDWDIENMTDDEVITAIDSEAERLALANVDLIKQQTAHHGLRGYSFHIYMVPFLLDRKAKAPHGIERVRMGISQAIKNGYVQ